jgi:hypothetical protein
MALEIKDYIISSLLLANHYLRLMIIVTVGLACQVELPVAGGYVLEYSIMVYSC